MTVLKLNSSGKAVQIITDEGKVYQTSVSFIRNLITGKIKSGILPTSRLPFNVSVDRFKPSVVWDPDGTFVSEENKKLTVGNDALSAKTADNNKDRKSFEDKSVW